MSVAHHLAEQFEADQLSEALPVVVPADAPVESPTIPELLTTIALLTARVAELEAPPQEHWLPLKAAAFDCAMIGETLRAQCADGRVQARREGKRWFVNVMNVKERQRRFGQRK